MTQLDKADIALEVFKRTGIALSPDDPVMVLADICQQIIKQDTELYIDKQQAVLAAIKDVPGAITEAVHVIAQAVERAETISGELAESAVAKAKAEATEAIASGLKAHLSGANDGLADIERRLKLAGDSIRDKKSFRLNMVLGVALLFCAVSFPLALLLQLKTVDNAQKEAAFYLRELSKLERGISQLPPALQEKVKQGG